MEGGRKVGDAGNRAKLASERVNAPFFRSLCTFLWRPWATSATGAGASSSTSDGSSPPPIVSTSETAGSFFNFCKPYSAFPSPQSDHQEIWGRRMEGGAGGPRSPEDRPRKRDHTHGFMLTEAGPTVFFARLVSHVCKLFNS